MKKGVFMCVFVLLLFGICSGCGNEGNMEKGETRVITDMRGMEVEVPEKIESYVVYWVGATDIAAMMDGFEGLTGYPETSAGFSFLNKMYPEIKNCRVLPKDDISAEEILSCGADVVFVRYSDQQELFDNLAEAGISVVDVEFDDYETMMDAVDVVASVFGTKDAYEKAEKFRTYTEKTIKEVTDITAMIKREERPTILTIRDADTLRAYGPGRYAGRWVDYIGAVSCLDLDNPNGYVNLTEEQLLEYDPSYIVFALEKQKDIFCEKEISQQLSCVKNGTVYNSPVVLNSWSNQGAESVLMLKWGLYVMHEEECDFDMEQEMKDFYKKFYEYEFTDEEVEEILKEDK